MPPPGCEMGSLYIDKQALSQATPVSLAASMTKRATINHDRTKA